MATYNFPSQYRGDTFQGMTFTITEADVPVNLTGASIAIQWRLRSATGTLAKEVTIGDGITLDNAAGGQFSIDPFDIDDVNWVAGTYLYDVQVTLGSVTRTYFGGNFIILEDVTKPTAP